MADAYQEFLEAKVQLAQVAGFACDDPHPWMKPHAALTVRWMLQGGRRAVFASFGLHKTSMQLDAGRLTLKHLTDQGHACPRGIIVLPLGVRQEFMRDAASLGVEVRFVQTLIECWAPGLYLTNYESVRDGKLDISGFDYVSLDEAACLRGMGGTKTFRVLAGMLEGVPYRFVATATPSPNEYIELLAYAEVLGVMDIGQAKTRFFKRNSEKADQLTLHPHKEREFWLWVASWALFITKPSDLGCSDEGYQLSTMQVTWHEVAAGGVDFDETGEGKSGQQRELFKSTKIGVSGQAREKRGTLLARVAKMAEICAADPDAHRILWHDLNDERDLISQALPQAFVLDGSQDDETKEARLLGFADGFFQYLAAKPVMAGAGCNFQRHCRKAVFVGIGFKFHDFIQAVHRIHRFGQTGVVEIDVIYADSEREVRRELERKWTQHNEMVAKMGEIMREYGLSSAAMADQLKRGMGVERIVAYEGDKPYLPGCAGVDATAAIPDPWSGRYWLAHNDTVIETRGMPADSVDLIVTSVPFSTQYEYSPNYCDFGHTDSNEHFWQQMRFLVSQLFRVLKPGRDACIHIKDRIVPGGINGLGFQTVYPFGDDCRAIFREAGFAYLGKHTNTTDVVRENNQTYRLGHSEQLKDGTRMGSGLPEEILLFRKPPSDLSNGYADQPVAKPRPDYVDAEGQPAEYSRQAEQDGAIRPAPGTGYSRARWQIDAHHYWRSSGDRLLKPEEWVTFENMDQVYRLWREFNLNTVYDYEQHVRFGERLDAVGKLPAIFMLQPPHSWHADVWTDVAQMRSMNTLLAQAGAEKHLCPLPFDIVNRLITQRSQPGEWVYDPFAGVGTVPYCALKLGRRGCGSELNPDYWAAAAKYLEAAAEESRPVPTLFDLIEEREVAA